MRRINSAHRDLAAAVLLQAIKDAKSSNGRATEARKWLAESWFADFLLGSLDIPRERLAAAVELDNGTGYAPK